MRALLDLSTIPPGQEQQRLASFLSARPDVEPANLTVLAPSNSVSIPSGGTLVASDGDPGQRWDIVKAELTSFLADSENGPRTVASFQQSVGDLVREVAQTQTDVSYYDLRGALQPNRLSRWPGHFMAREDAFDVLRRALNRHAGTLRFTGVRPAMTQVDPRFKKDTDNPRPIDRPNFISLLIAEATKAGLVTTDGPEDNPFVRLNESTLVSAEPQTKAAGTPTRSNEAVFARQSDRYLHLLRSADLGPFQQVRTTIYAQIPAILSTSEERPTVGGLLDGAVAQVRSEIETARSQGREYLVRKDQNMPWSQVRGFLGILFTRNAVLIGHQGPVRADWVHLGDQVHGLVDNWEEILDSELVFHLIRHGCEINQYTEVDLSGALYNTRQELGRVHQLLKYMLESGKCGYTHDYSLRLV